MNKMLTTAWALAATLIAGGVAAQTPAGNAAAGAQKNAMCIGCHGIVGYRASFPEVYSVPMISGQQAGYIASALQAYKKGDRKNPTMQGIAASLTEQDMADLAAFYSAQPGATSGASAPEAPSAKVEELIKKGACLSCHGEGFSKPIDPSYPKIAGQHSDYLFVALKSYNMKNSHVWGRANPIMGGVTSQFTNQELRELSRHIAKQPTDLKVVPQSKFR